MSLRNLVVFAMITAATAISQPITAQGQDRASTADAAAIAQFDAAIAQYLKIRRQLVGEVAPPVANSTAAELNRASDALAAAIQRARKNARQGAIFVQPVTPIVKRRVAEAVQRENLGPVLANIDDDSSTTPVPKVHLRFPVASQMATMPPSLLAALPQLPKELEYRVVGNYLIIRDVDAALIIDFVAGVIPR